ncbi:rhodanese-like domain-containing protein [Aureispira anguillae]|uniref:Rhodanese-like domain-containing protein n=1 Tax=Aureispira anguillae TaxID=2864201 RepID=A0A915YII8_9BACT|nr:rhodanese-like domain-containing protein [Aureispira anguillae]BDS13695.1 rhodanese-like domain-containing protein [Aureispira anguillae]
MKHVLLVLIPFFVFSITNFSQAQRDPFAVVPSQRDAAALSPSELPKFEEYCANPENINVTPVPPKELNYIIEDSREKFFILDARSKEEYNISHIENAKRTGYKDFSVERVWMVDRQARVIVYSSNQKRGYLVAQYLKLMGFIDVQILENGLIGWKNTGHEVFDKDGKTDKVHVGSRSNLKLLKSGLGIY